MSVHSGLEEDPGLVLLLRAGGAPAITAATASLSRVLQHVIELVDSDRGASRAVRNSMADRAEATQGKLADTETWSIGVQSATDLLAACGTGAELVAIAAGNVEFATDFSTIEGLLDTIDGWLTSREDYETEAAALKIQATVRGNIDRKAAAKVQAAKVGQTKDASPGTFELEDTSPREKKEKKPKRQSKGGPCGKCVACFDSLFDDGKMLYYFLSFVVFQGMMYCIWLVLASGLVMPANKKSELACIAYFFIIVYQAKILSKYKKMMREVTFSQNEDHDFYHRCYSQLNFHTQMVVFPMVAMLVITLIFTFSFMETLNYNNVRIMDDANSSVYAVVTPGGVGCTDDRAINYNPLAASGLAELCNFARCYEDVYMVENQSTQMTAFSAIFFGMYVCCFISAYFVSRCHLRFVEKLYFQRHKAKILLKDVWRKVIRSSAASDKMNGLFAVSSASKLRAAHIIQFLAQGMLCCALMVGKLAVGDKRWFLEFDVMIILWGYEAGRHFPTVNYVAGAGGMGDIYAIGTRLRWHHSSMYHYFAMTAIEAYLSVSGAYRMLPPDGSEGLSAYGLEYGDICPSPVSDISRRSAVSAAALSFFLLFLSAGWLTLSHYFNYQSVKRDHATILAFADAFKSMLERKRRRAELAFDRNAKSPKANGETEEHNVDQLRPNGSRKRGILRFEAPMVVFILGETRNSVFIETDRETFALDDIIRFEAVSKSPPELILWKRDGSKATFATKDARSIASKFTRLLGDYRGGRTEPRLAAGGSTFESESSKGNGGGAQAAGQMSAEQMQAMMAQQQQMMMTMMQQQQATGGGGAGAGGSRRAFVPVQDDE